MLYYGDINDNNNIIRLADCFVFEFNPIILILYHIIVIILQHAYTSYSVRDRRGTKTLNSTSRNNGDGFRTIDREIASHRNRPRE